MSGSASDNTRDIVQRALGLRAGQRTGYLDAACAGDLALRRDVERQIAMEESATIVGAAPSGPTPPPEPNQHLAPSSEPGSDGSPGHPTRIGGYRILSVLGQGAMGVVYRAEQQNPRREIALKVIRVAARSGSPTDADAARFAIETRALARLQHPGIAQIYEAGTADTPSGPQAYFAMELVRGEALDIATRDMDQRAVVRLFVKVAEAVEHAHQRGVLHRDLKPANILVDAEGQPKVLDFGVARALEAEQEAPAPGPGQRAVEIAGTVPYMSPEQLTGDLERIDTRSDVYALGVVLYELLAGRRPYDLSATTLEEARTIIGGEPPAPPSRDAPRRVSTDLDAIVAKAMASDPDHRYASASELAADLKRSLDRFPVAARRATGVYVLSRFTARQPGLVAGIALAVLAIAGGVAGVSWQAVEATRGRELARQEAARVTAVNAYLNDMLASADPEVSLGNDLTVRELVDQTAATIGDSLRGQPRIEASVRMTLASTYRGLGELDRAETQARAMVALCEMNIGVDDQLTTDAWSTLAGVLAEKQEMEEGERLALRALGWVQARHGPHSAEAAVARSGLARVVHETGRHSESLALWREALQDAQRELGPAHRETLIIQHNIGAALKDLGEFEEAERTLEQVVALREATFGQDHPQTLAAKNMLAGIIQKEGRNAEAAERMREVLASRQRVLGDDHFLTIITKGNLGTALIGLGELDEAERLTREALDGFRDRFGEDSPRTLVTMGNLAYLLEDQGKDDEAAELYRKTIDIQRRSAGGTDPETWSTMNNLAMLLQRRGEYDEAKSLYDDLLAMCRDVLPTGHYYTALFENNYGECLLLMGDLRGARRALTESHAVLVKTFGEGHPRVVKSDGRIERLRDAEQRSANGS